MDTNFEDISPDTLFSERFQNHLDARVAFKEYFSTHYQKLDTIRELTYTTNHAFYTLFYNESKNDVRILRDENGCFHSHQEFVSIESVEKKISDIKKNLELHKDDPQYTSFHEPQLPPLEKVVEVYRNPVKNENGIKSNKM